MRWIYSLLYTCAFVVGLPYFLLKGMLSGKYLTTFGQRLGGIPLSSDERSLWIHTVSVGEFLACQVLIKRIKQDMPDVKLFVSTTTLSGQMLAKTVLPEACFYFPFDWGWCIRRIFRRIRPGLIVILETEIWPNFMCEARAHKIPMLLINGRISNRSFKRYKLVRRWLPRFDECLMQTEEDAEKMKALGAQNVTVIGNVKYDFRPPVLPASLSALLTKWKSESLLWIAGSTMPGEDEIILDAYGKLRKRYPLKLLIAPRHPERFQEVADLVARTGIPFGMRSAEKTEGRDILILDTIGELAAAYEFADFALIGGSLTEPFGGHNPIEPAYFGKAIVNGPGYVNFKAIFEEFQQKKAVLISADLQSAVQELITNPILRKQMGDAAISIIQSNSGATEKAMDRVRFFWNAVLEPDSKLSVR